MGGESKWARSAPGPARVLSGVISDRTDPLCPPTWLGGDDPGKEIQSPLAAVVLGGLLSATGLNMVVLPALYWLFARPATPDPAGAAP